MPSGTSCIANGKKRVALHTCLIYHRLWLFDGSEERGDMLMADHDGYGAMDLQAASDPVELADSGGRAADSAGGFRPIG